MQTTANSNQNAERPLKLGGSGGAPVTHSQWGWLPHGPPGRERGPEYQWFIPDKGLLRKGEVPPRCMPWTMPA